MASWPYNTVRWQRLRRAHLDQFPLCIACHEAGTIREANTVDHRVAISDGGPAFPGHDGLHSYCTSCHSKKTARGPEAGAVRASRHGCDEHGNPLDPAHPWNGGTGRLPGWMEKRRLPSQFKPSRIPLTIVCGPPGSGKSTYVRENAGPRDVIICLDTISQAITGLAEHHTPRWAVGKALDKRNAMLRALARDTKHERAWFIVSAPKPSERRKWASRLGGQLVVMDTPLRECIRRIKADPTRPPEHHERMIDAAIDWWQANPHLVRRCKR